MQMFLVHLQDIVFSDICLIRIMWCCLVKWKYICKFTVKIIPTKCKMNRIKWISNVEHYVVYVNWLLIKSHGHVIRRTERLMYCMISKMLRCIFKVHYVYLFFIVKSGLTSCKGFLNSFVSRHYKKGGQMQFFIYNSKVSSWIYYIVYCYWTVDSSYMTDISIYLCTINCLFAK